MTRRDGACGVRLMFLERQVVELAAVAEAGGMGDLLGGRRLAVAAGDDRSAGILFHNDHAEFAEGCAGEIGLAGTLPVFGGQKQGVGRVGLGDGEDGIGS